jgi:hypothetical protein
MNKQMSCTMKTAKYAAILMAAITLASSAQAAQTYWVVPSGDFSNPANWSAAPTATDSPTFNNWPTVPANQSINMDVSASVQTVFNDWDAGTYVNTIDGLGTLTITGGGDWAQGIANRAGAGGGGTLNMAGKVVINNPFGVTDIRNQNGADNIIEFTSTSTLTLASTAVTLDFATGSAIRFNGTLNGSANLMIQSKNVSFNAGHNSSGHTGDILLNGVGSKLTINGGTVSASGNQLIGNWGGNTIVLNAANAINGAGISSWGGLTLDVNAGQNNMGSINEVQASGLTIDILGLGLGEGLWFANSSGGAWTGSVSILGFQENVVRFGTDSSGLTAGQLAKINGGIYSLDGSGYLTAVPVPEPTALALVLLGGMGLLVARRKRA